MNTETDNNVFFLKGHSKFAISRAEDLINLHKNVNCRGDMDFVGLGHFVNEFFNNQKSIILFERNPLLLKNKINKLVLDQIRLVCGRRFKAVGASCAVELNNLFIPKLKYVTIFQRINDAIISNLYHSIFYFRFNNRIVSKEYTQNEDFLRLVEKYPNSKINLEELEADLYDSKALLNLHLRDWITCVSKDVNYFKANNNFKESILWVDFDILKSQTKTELDRIFNFLELDPELLHSEDNFSNGTHDYDYSYKSLFNKESLKGAIGDQWYNTVMDLETEAINFCKANYKA